MFSLVRVRVSCVCLGGVYVVWEVVLKEMDLL